MGGRTVPRPIGTSTRDVSDAEDTAARLDDFNNEWQRLRFGTVAGREW